MTDGSDSIEATEREAVAVNKTESPRVTLSEIREAVGHTVYCTGANLLQGGDNGSDPPPYAVTEALSVLTLCFVVMKNGFVVVGKSAPASPARYDETLGRKFAFDDAVRQLWPLMGFELKERLYRIDLFDQHQKQHPSEAAVEEDHYVDPEPDGA